MLIEDGTAGVTLGLGADQGTIIEQVKRKHGAWTVEGLAAFLDVSPKLLYKLIKVGKLNAYKIGTLIRIDGQDVGNYLALHATSPLRPQQAKLR
jgi:excisionase family DNA binding protein